MRALLAEDDRMIGEAVVNALRDASYAVDWVRDGEAASDALRSHDYDVVLLDLGIPGKDGLAVLRSLRLRGDAAPVLVITARDAIDDRNVGLDAGADDYIVKPFDMGELLRPRPLGRPAKGGIAAPGPFQWPAFPRSCDARGFVRRRRGPVDGARIRASSSPALTAGRYPVAR